MKARAVSIDLLCTGKKQRGVTTALEARNPSKRVCEN
jgi:hypothetical protein